MERMKQSFIGEVVSTAMEKTVTVKVTRWVPHKVYKKIMKQSQKYLAHVTTLAPAKGDIVRITSRRPISKRKRWQVSAIIRKAVTVEK